MASLSTLTKREKAGHGLRLVGHRTFSEVQVQDFAWCWTTKAARERGFHEDGLFGQDLGLD